MYVLLVNKWLAMKAEQLVVWGLHQLMCVIYNTLGGGGPPTSQHPLPVRLCPSAAGAAPVTFGVGERRQQRLAAARDHALLQRSLQPRHPPRHLLKIYSKIKKRK